MHYKKITSASLEIVISENFLGLYIYIHKVIKAIIEALSVSSC